MYLCNQLIINVVKISYLIFFTLLGLAVFAQPGNPSNPTPFGFPEVLAAGGALYGARRLYRKKKG